MTDPQPSWPFSLNDPARAVHFAMEPDCPYSDARSCPTESYAVRAIAAFKAWASVHPHAVPRRRLTELEHDAAWHAVEGAAGEAGPCPDTVLNAVLAALSIDPPGTVWEPCSPEWLTARPAGACDAAQRLAGSVDVSHYHPAAPSA